MFRFVFVDYFEFLWLFALCLLVASLLIVRCFVPHFYVLLHVCLLLACIVVCLGALLALWLLLACFVILSSYFMLACLFLNHRLRGLADGFVYRAHLSK